MLSSFHRYDILIRLVDPLAYTRYLHNVLGRLESAVFLPVFDDSLRQGLSHVLQDHQFIRRSRVNVDFYCRFFLSSGNRRPERYTEQN